MLHTNGRQFSTDLRALGMAMSSGASVTLPVVNNGFAVLFVIIFVPAFDTGVETD